MRALAIILKYGFVAVKQAVANGQYDFPKGLFFGGIELQEELVNYKEWLLKNLPLVNTPSHLVILFCGASLYCAPE